VRSAESFFDSYYLSFNDCRLAAIRVLFNSFFGVFYSNIK
jgi:hypothetical protein